MSEYKAEELLDDLRDVLDEHPSKTPDDRGVQMAALSALLCITALRFGINKTTLVEGVRMTFDDVRGARNA